MAEQLKGILVDEPWIDRILDGTRTWEMRKRGLKHRGPVALIRRSDRTVVGLAVLEDVGEPLETREAFASAEGHHGMSAGEQGAALDAGLKVPWVLTEVRRLAEPHAYASAQASGPTVSLSEEDSAAVVSAVTVPVGAAGSAPAGAAPGGARSEEHSAPAASPAAPGHGPGEEAAAPSRSTGLFDRFVRWISGT